MSLLFLLACSSSTDAVPTATAQSGTFEVRLAVPGNLAAVDEERITRPEFNGRPEIAWIAAQGTPVEAGDRIVEFDQTELVAALDAAENELELARTKILQNEAKLALAIASAEAGIQGAELDLRLARMRRTDSDTVPLVQREEARVAEQKSTIAIDTARSSLSSVKLESRADTQLLALEVAQKEREVAELEEQLQNTIVTAPSDGLVLLKPKWDGALWQVGGRPWDGAVIASLPDLSEMKVLCEVHEVDSPRVAVDQTATVILEAFPDRTFTGRVSKVADLAVPKGEDEIKFLDIEVELDASKPEMKPGLSARVELTLSTHPDSVWIPLEAVVREDDATSVWVSGLTGWRQVDVQLGVESDTHVIVEGLDAGAEVALAPPYAEEARKAAEL